MGKKVRWPTRPTSKYHAKPASLDGVRFDSKAEARRYAELLLLQRAGEIRQLRCHPPFPLLAAVLAPSQPKRVRAAEVAFYIPDFAYDERSADGTWTLVIEDVKGVRTPTYRLKKRWFETCYGVEIRETTRS